MSGFRSASRFRLSRNDRRFVYNLKSFGLQGPCNQIHFNVVGQGVPREHVEEVAAAIVEFLNKRFPPSEIIEH